MADKLLRETVLPAIGPDDAPLEFQAALEVMQGHHRYRLTLTAPAIEQVEVEAGDAFEALRQARRHLERRDILIRCAGARLDVWASGMQRDMGQGLSAYVLSLPRRNERPPEVDIFEPVAAELAATVDDQERFYAEWRRSPLA